MKIKTAIEVTGGLSDPSKMPCKSYNLPSTHCVFGSTLKQNAADSVCSVCYASKGRYRFPNVCKAMETRLNLLEHPDWVEGMISLISKQSPEYFRWHDSGDIQSREHYANIMLVVYKTPDTLHYLPTKEYRVVNEYPYPVPANLCIRFSNPFINGEWPEGQFEEQRMQYCDGIWARKGFINYACTYKDKEAALDRGLSEDAICLGSVTGSCGDCRKCWDRSVSCTAYLSH